MQHERTPRTVWVLERDRDDWAEGVFSSPERAAEVIGVPVASIRPHLTEFVIDEPDAEPEADKYAAYKQPGLGRDDDPQVAAERQTAHETAHGPRDDQ